MHRILPAPHLVVRVFHPPVPEAKPRSPLLESKCCNDIRAGSATSRDEADQGNDSEQHSGDSGNGHGVGGSVVQGRSVISDAGVYVLCFARPAAAKRHAGAIRKSHARGAILEGHAEFTEGTPQTDDITFVVVEKYQ